MQIRYFITLIATVFLALFFFIKEDNKSVTFMATTTLRDSGLLSVLLPVLRSDTGLDIQLVAFGTGKVLRSAADGNADIIMVHDPAAEEIFMKQGLGDKRIELFRNNFVIVGPQNDPAKVKTSTSVAEAFKNISLSEQPFISRADNSGTHHAELRIWKVANIDVNEISQKNYIETGTGMGRTINVAVEKSAYMLVDRATWLTFQNKGKMEILFTEDPLLENTYSIITPNLSLHSHISAENQNAIVNWFLSEKALNLIENYQVNNQQLFHMLNKS